MRVRFIAPLLTVALMLVFAISRRRQARNSRRVDEEKTRLAMFVLTVCSTVVVNGMICGALSGPYDRYQARVVWLVPFLATLCTLF
jgi:hypothetical protein